MLFWRIDEDDQVIFHRFYQTELSASIIFKMIFNRIYGKKFSLPLANFKYHFNKILQIPRQQTSKERPAGGIDCFPEKFSSNNSDLVEQLSLDVILFDGIIVERVIIANITLSELLLYSQTIVSMSR